MLTLIKIYFTGLASARYFFSFFSILSVTIATSTKLICYFRFPQYNILDRTKVKKKRNFFPTSLYTLFHIYFYIARVIYVNLLDAYARRDFSNLEIIAVRMFIVNCLQFLWLNFLVVFVCGWKMLLKINSTLSFLNTLNYLCY